MTPQLLVQCQTHKSTYSRSRDRYTLQGNHQKQSIESEDDALDKRENVVIIQFLKTVQSVTGVHLGKSLV